MIRTHGGGSARLAALLQRPLVEGARTRTSPGRWLSTSSKGSSSSHGWDARTWSRRIGLGALPILGFCAYDVSTNRSQSHGEKEKDDASSGPNEVASVIQYPANRPIEDRTYMERLSNGAWWFSVFDGHGGWQCSDYASKHLHSNVEKAMGNHLGDSFSQDTGELYEGKIDRRTVTKALKSAFERTDRQYMVKVYGAFELGFGRDTRAGSCGLGTLVFDGLLFVANAGDSRAVLAVNRSGYQASTASLARKADNRSSKIINSAEAEVDMHGERWSIDELMGAAALKDSIGEEISPQMAEALREKLLNQINELKQQGRGTEEDIKALTAAARKKTVERIQNEASAASSSSANHANAGNSSSSSSSSSNPFVTAVRMFTGGQHKDSEPPSEFVAIDMSNDHNCREPREREVLEKNHPGEKDVVICRVDNPDQCYIKGKLQPTRAFGDFYLKYSEFMRGPSEDSAAGRYVPPPYTPPYISATPEVQVRTLRKGVDEFIIMGTDGLWDLMSSQEAVDIVGTQLRKPGGSPKAACEVLVEEALRRAARAHGLSVNQLKSLKTGRARRSKHDDISVIVVDLAKLIELHYWG